MRDFKLVFLISVLVSIAHSIHAQIKTPDPNQVFQNGQRFFYQENSYSYRELGPLFEDIQDFNVLHTKAVKNKKLANLFGGVTIGMGIWAYVIGANCEDLGCIAILLPMSIGSVTGTVSLIQINTAVKSKKNSLILLNNSLRRANLESNRGSSLSIGASVNGIGVFFRF